MFDFSRLILLNLDKISNFEIYWSSVYRVYFINLRKLCSNYNDFMSYGCHKCTFSFVERILRFRTCCAMAILYSWQYNKEHSLNFVMFKLDTKNIKAALQNFEEIFLYCWWVVHLILSNLKNAIIIITYNRYIISYLCGKKIHFENILLKLFGN